MATVNKNFKVKNGVDAASSVTALDFESTNSVGDEGGELRLNKAATNTTLTTGVTLDVYQNKVRLFETGGTNRGGYWDISALAAGVGTNLASGSGGGSGTYTFSTTAPTSPTAGDRWTNSSTGIEYIYINDGTSSAWVNIESAGFISALNLTGTDITTAGTYYPVFLSTTSTGGLTVNSIYTSSTKFSVNPSTGALTAGSYIVSGGTSSQFLKADGSTDSSTYLTTGTASTTYAPLASPTFTGTVNAADLTLSGNLTVNGTLTTINSTTIAVDDKNIELGAVTTPTDTTADGGGITLKGTTDKTFNWINANTAFTSSERLMSTFGTTGSSTMGAFAYGTMGYSDQNTLASFVSGVNTYNQIVIQNTSSNAAASADIIINNNLGTATTYYVNLGMNSSNFTGAGSFNLSGAGYLSVTTGDLVLGTTTANTIHFVTNSSTTDAMTINSSGVTSVTSLLATPAIPALTNTSDNVGYVGMPQVLNPTSPYTLSASDSGKHVYMTTTGRTITVPANSVTAFEVGTSIVILNAAGVTTTISINTDTLLQVGTGLTGSRTLAPYGMATLLKITATSWVISGVGIS